MSPVITAIVVGAITMYVAFKLLKFALKMAFFAAIAVGGVAAYLAYAAG